MKTSLLFFLTVSLISIPSYSFVSGPSSVKTDENLLTISNQSEGGTIEPNTNKSSFQSAQISILKLRYSRGLKNPFDSGDSSLFIEAGQFSSGKEQVGSNLFYDEDKGSFVILGYSFDLIHTPEKQLSLYAQASPSRSYNKNKFSNPRLDLFALGLVSSFSLSENLFQKSLIHYGSGDTPEQNSSIAVDIGFGYKLTQILGRQAVITSSLFLEADTSEHFDSAYDTVFSPTGTQDRVRSFKYGSLVGFDIELTKNTALNLSYLQKLGGYDARSTQILSAGLSLKF